MLINKLIIEYKYMFVRSTDPKYLKYIMDLGMFPLVVNCTNNTVTYLCYISLGCVCDCRWNIGLPNNIRPLTISEIKNILIFVSAKMRIYKEDYKFYLKQIIFVHFPPTYIDRNELWKKY